MVGDGVWAGCGVGNRQPRGPGVDVDVGLYIGLHIGLHFRLHIGPDIRIGTDVPQCADNPTLAARQLTTYLQQYFMKEH